MQHRTGTCTQDMEFSFSDSMCNQEPLRRTVNCLRISFSVKVSGLLLYDVYDKRYIPCLAFRDTPFCSLVTLSS